MTSSNHVFIVTTIDSDGDTWILHVCDALDTAQLARHRFASQLVLDGHAPDMDTAIDRRQLRIAYHQIEDRAALERSYSPK
jgi:hypothetical protein